MPYKALWQCLCDALHDLLLIGEPYRPDSLKDWISMYTYEFHVAWRK